MLSQNHSTALFSTKVHAEQAKQLLENHVSPTREGTPDVDASSRTSESEHFRSPPPLL